MLRTMNKYLFPALLATVSTAFSDASIDRTRDVIDNWVETRQIISKENADWRLEQSILNDTRSLLENEVKRLESALADLDASASVADEERSGLSAERDELAAAAEVVAAEVAAMETQVKALLQLLPEPLLATIRPLVRRLPDDPQNTSLSLGERVQNIVGILSQADKFNGTVTFTSETRPLDNGKEVEVRTLYWGVAMAFYVDASGDYAGIGHPGANGWEWPRIDGAGPKIQRLLDVYEGTGEIGFVEVPARIQ